MIVDSLQNADLYVSLHPALAEAFAFLRRPDLAQLAAGRHEIRGPAIYATVARDTGRGREQSLLEFHRRYIDIQFVVEQRDLIGWLPTSHCERIATAYDGDKDIGFYYDRPETWLDIPAGYFAVLFPEDAHAPMAATGLVHKVIVKVEVEAKSE
jgi:YhcH/YjgK/YiaL family protein